MTYATQSHRAFDEIETPNRKRKPFSKRGAGQDRRNTRRDAIARKRAWLEN